MRGMGSCFPGKSGGDLEGESCRRGGSQPCLCGGSHEECWVTDVPKEATVGGELKFIYVFHE